MAPARPLEECRCTTPPHLLRGLSLRLRQSDLQLLRPDLLLPELLLHLLPQTMHLLNTQRMPALRPHWRSSTHHHHPPIHPFCYLRFPRRGLSCLGVRGGVTRRGLAGGTVTPDPDLWCTGTQTHTHTHTLGHSRCVFLLKGRLRCTCRLTSSTISIRFLQVFNLRSTSCSEEIPSRLMLLTRPSYT